jgi:acyl-CoA synthetase (AMP-forming)/AMP-acid ligase II
MDELRFDLQDFRIDLLLLEEDTDPMIRALATELGVPVAAVNVSPSQTGLIELEKRGLETDPDEPSPDDLMVLFHTSGTTARPKIVPFNQYSRVAELEIPAYWRLLEDPGRWLNALPLHHGQGLIGEAQHPLMTGSSVFITQFDPAKFIQQVRESESTCFSLVPSMHRRVVDSASGREDVFSGTPLRFAKTTSAALDRSLFEAMQKTYGVPIVESFAAQECSFIAIRGLESDEIPKGSVGKIAHRGVAIHDESGNPVPPNVNGEICVETGPLVIHEYENNVDATADAFRGGFYRTGDLGYVDEMGNLYPTGRLRETINRGGELISPQEIDEVLVSHPSVAMAAAFGVASDDMGEEVMAAVVLNPGESIDAQELRAFVARAVTFAKVPKRIFIVDDLPLNAIGKVMRRELAGKLL